MKSAGRACCRGHGSQPNYGKNLVENKEKTVKNQEKVKFYVDPLMKKSNRTPTLPWSSIISASVSGLFNKPRGSSHNIEKPHKDVKNHEKPRFFTNLKKTVVFGLFKLTPLRL